MNEIQTNRLILRRFRESDLDNLFIVVGDPKVGQMLPKGEAYTKAETEGWLDGFQRHWEINKFGVWAIVLQSDDDCIGFCGLRLFPEFDEVEVLYSLSPNKWGQGFASEAASASVKYGLHNLHLNKIIGLTKMNNPASSAVLIKTGLSFIKDTELFNIPCKYYEIIN